MEEGLQLHRSADAIVITSAKFIEETTQVLENLGRLQVVVGVFDLNSDAMKAIENDDIAFAMRQNEFSQVSLGIGVRL